MGTTTSTNTKLHWFSLGGAAAALILGGTALGLGLRKQPPPPPPEPTVQETTIPGPSVLIPVETTKVIRTVVQVKDYEVPGVTTPPAPLPKLATPLEQAMAERKKIEKQVKLDQQRAQAPVLDTVAVRTQAVKLVQDSIATSLDSPAAWADPMVTVTGRASGDVVYSISGDYQVQDIAKQYVAKLVYTQGSFVIVSLTTWGGNG